jgi:hypothetical protein
MRIVGSRAEDLDDKLTTPLTFCGMKHTPKGPDRKRVAEARRGG